MKTMKLLTALLIFIFFNEILISQTFPAGFSQVKIASITEATAMRFAPDGRIFVCQRDGTVNIIKNGLLLSTPFVKLTTDQNGERAVSGITFDPNFNTNHYLYIYYTATTPTIHNRLSRFTANGDVVLAGSEFPLLDAETVNAVFHNGGGLDFGKDGKLYLSMGEDNSPNNAQSLTTYKGKLLRLNSDGTAPSDNPYSSSTNEATKRIWCTGLRNPYTLAIQPGTGRIFINNVGSDYWEEIHDGTSSGKNFGWPIVEGLGSNPAYTNPIFAYPHDSAGQHGCAITGGTFFNPVASNYPSQYVGKYFYMEFCNGWVYYLTPGTTSYTNNTLFATGLTTQNLALQVGPDGNLYYLNRHAPQAGVYKIIYNNNNAPTISSQPANLTVVQGQQASFSVSATGTMPLNYQWRKGTTNITGANSSTYTIPNTVNTDAGQYSVIVSNAFGSALSNSATLTLTKHNDPPVATIITPAVNAHYHAGDVINFSGNATDTEDHNLPASSYEWTVEFWHNNNHFHPGPFISPGIKSGSFTIPNIGETSPIVFYRLRLKVTDSDGLIDTPHVDILPLESTITINTIDPGLQITYDGQPKTTPFSTLAVRGMLISIGVVSPQIKDTTNYAFDHWLKGGASSHIIKIGDGDSTYTAVFKDTVASCVASGTILREVWNNITGSAVSLIPVMTTPSSSGQISIFESPKNYADNYGERISGFICPPETGNYTFWIASDNSSELWLSTNDNPINKIKIASVTGYTASHEWTKFPSQKSVLINLMAGVKYYIEALHKEADMGDNLSVGWQLPSGLQERPIAGNRLSPYSAPGSAPPMVMITSPANNYTHAAPVNITINADASSATSTIAKVEFFQGTTKIGEDLTSPYSFTWMNVTTGNYALNAMATDNNGVMGMSENVNVMITTCATATITPAGPTTMCSGSVLLKANTGAGIIYQWKKDGTDISGATSSTFSAAVSGDYQVKVIQGSCISWSSPIKVRIQSGLSASITPGGPTTFCNGGNVKLYSNTCTGYTYQWKKNNVDIVGATTATYTATSSGNYQIKVTQASVSVWSSLLAVTVNSCIGDMPNDESNSPLTISEPTNPSGGFQMKVFPNPNNGLFTIIVNTPTLKEEKIKLKIVNVLGQEVYNKEFIANSDYFKETVELDNSLKTGIYTLQLMIGNKIENTSIVLAK